MYWKFVDGTNRHQQLETYISIYFYLFYCYHYSSAVCRPAVWPLVNPFLCEEWRVHHHRHQLVQLCQPVEPQGLLRHRQTQSPHVSVHTDTHTPSQPVWGCNVSWASLFSLTVTVVISHDKVVEHVRLMLVSVCLFMHVCLFTSGVLWMKMFLQPQLSMGGRSWIQTSRKSVSRSTGCYYRYVHTLTHTNTHTHAQQVNPLQTWHTYTFHTQNHQFL